MGVPRVKTPNVVDFPLSTLPTTAHRTSGVRDTFGGGSLSNKDSRGCPALVSKSTEVYNITTTFRRSIFQFSVRKNLTLPPTSSTTFVNCSRSLSRSSTVLAIPDQSGDWSFRSPPKSSVCDGCCPIRNTYSPWFCVNTAATKSRARS
jgi:hypothetical protein